MNRSICPLCSSTSTTLLIDKVRFDYAAKIMKCNDCGLVFLDQASYQTPGDFYENQYHQTYLTHIEPDALDPDKYFNKMMKTSQPWIERIKMMLKGDESILDVGCSTGHLIVGLQDYVKEIYGHELSKKEVKYCQEKHGLDVSDQPLSERFEENKFDYITMIFVLEHISDPVNFLKDLKKYLKPDGKFIILVPNINDPLVSLYQIPEFYQFYFCVEHLFYYSGKTIADVFKRAGLEGNIESLQEYPLTNHLSWMYTKKPSNVLMSRKYLPHVELVEPSLFPEWEKLWESFNETYQNFLTEKGFGDRLWCVIGKAND